MALINGVIWFDLAVTYPQAPSIKKWFTTFSAHWWTMTKWQLSVTTFIMLCRRQPMPWVVGQRTSPYSIRSSSLKNSCSSSDRNISNETNRLIHDLISFGLVPPVMSGYGGAQNCFLWLMANGTPWNYIEQMKERKISKILSKILKLELNKTKESGQPSNANKEILKEKCE